MSELSENLQNVRQVVQREMSAMLQVAIGEVTAKESIWIVNGIYVGHCFDMGDYLAKWRHDSNSIEVFESNKKLKEVDLEDVMSQQRSVSAPASIRRELIEKTSESRRAA